ncbi:MAG: cytidylyltransferase domain-containing protein, partial [Sediminibacterium sp.]
MKICAFIPARYAATRFPAKLMQPLGDKTVIRHTYDNTVATGLFSDVFVVTDSTIIFNEITHHGGKAIMSIHSHESGSDRIAEAITDLDIDVVVNVQGDEPFVKKEPLQKLLEVFKDSSQNVRVASLMQVLTSQQNIEDPNYVKV